jgi:lamin tail-like protein
MSLVLMTGLFGTVAIAPESASAAACVRISGGLFDAPGNDNLAGLLNGEYIRIKNFCAAAKTLTGWRLHDFNRLHTYSFRSGFKIGPGVTVTVYTGRGANSATKLFWQRAYGAVWNNKPPERAYLRNGAGTLQSSWSLY